MFYHVHVRAFSTLPSILAAISLFHCCHYLSTPTTSRAVTRALQGAKRLFGSPSTSRKIITKKILDDRFNLTLRRDASFNLIRTVWQPAQAPAQITPSLPRCSERLQLRATPLRDHTSANFLRSTTSSLNNSEQWAVPNPSSTSTMKRSQWKSG